MKHYREIDILRGIAIIMVFLGHAVIVYPINLENVAWCRGLVAFISAVHMPLFLCAEHGTNLTGESPVTGIYRQV